MALHDDDYDDDHKDDDDGLLKVSIQVCNIRRKRSFQRSMFKRRFKKRSNCVNIEGFPTEKEKKNVGSFCRSHEE